MNFKYHFSILLVLGKVINSNISNKSNDKKSIQNNNHIETKFGSSEEVVTEERPIKIEDSKPGQCLVEEILKKENENNIFGHKMKMMDKGLQNHSKRIELIESMKNCPNPSIKDEKLILDRNNVEKGENNDNFEHDGERSDDSGCLENKQTVEEIEFDKIFLDYYGTLDNEDLYREDAEEYDGLYSNVDSQDANNFETIYEEAMNDQQNNDFGDREDVPDSGYFLTENRDKESDFEKSLTDFPDYEKSEFFENFNRNEAPEENKLNLESEVDKIYDQTLDSSNNCDPQLIQDLNQFSDDDVKEIWQNKEFELNDRKLNKNSYGEIPNKDNINPLRILKNDSSIMNSAQNKGCDADICSKNQNNVNSFSNSGMLNNKNTNKLEFLPINSGCNEDVRSNYSHNQKPTNGEISETTNRIKLIQENLNTALEIIKEIEKDDYTPTLFNISINDQSDKEESKNMSIGVSMQNDEFKVADCAKEEKDAEKIKAIKNIDSVVNKTEDKMKNSINRAKYRREKNLSDYNESEKKVSAIIKRFENI